jgi:hypothetical protein
MSPLAFRLVTLGTVVAFLLATHAAMPGAEERSYHQYLIVIAVGYGHLLGAAHGALRGSVRSPLAAVFIGTTVAVAFVLYLEGVAAWPGLAFALLALSVWHFAENDLALGRALASGAALGPLPRGARAHAAPLAVTGIVIAAALAAAPDAGLLGDVFSAATLFHLVGWLTFLVARGTSRARLLALHAPPLALCAWLFASPAEATETLREWTFSPALYLFWASLHVLHTALARRAVAARAPPPSASPRLRAPRYVAGPEGDSCRRPGSATSMPAG